MPPSVPQIQQVAAGHVQSATGIARRTKKLRIPKPVVIILAAPCMLAAGLMLQSVAAGEAAIGAYAVIALVKRIKSRMTFMLALVSLLCIVVLLLARPDPVLMQNFAIYAFLFIVVGTVSLTMETRY
jgi:drug/metabolite transporter superfamily protein YnfA